MKTYFSRIKSIVIKESKSCEVNLQSKRGANLVLDVLKNVRKEYICSLWKSYVCQIEQEIASISDEM